MNIILVTAAPPGSEYGSETTSIRWEHNLSALGHHVATTFVYGKTEDDFADDFFDMMVVLGARECNEAIRAFKDRDGDRPIVVALNSEDVYLGIENSSEVRRNIERADALVVTQEKALEEIPHEFRERTHLIDQAVELPDGGVEAIPEPPLRDKRRTNDYDFEICVANHIQDQTDPLRTAKAARVFSEESGIFVTHIGRVLDARWEHELQKESDTNPRYDWLGEMAWTRALQYIKRADLVSVTSTIQGCANVLSESIVVGTPVVASAVPGNVGVLGEEYPGLFEPKNDEDLAKRIGAAEGDTRFYANLRRHCDQLRPDFDMARERDAWKALIDSLEPSGESSGVTREPERTVS